MTIEYRGYYYESEIDIEPGENRKIFHSCHCEHGGVRLMISTVPLSPYSRMTQGLWEMWIQAGRPTREMINGHYSEDIKRYWQKLYDEALDNILLGE